MTADVPAGRVNQKQRTRTAIVAAARDLISGSTEVTMPAVARAALVSEATAYRYFPDLVSLLREAVDGTWPSPAEALASVEHSTDPVERIAVGTERLLRHVQACQGAVRAMIAASVVRPGTAGIRPGHRFGIIDHALAPLESSLGRRDPQAFRQLKQDLAVVVSAEALFSLTDLCELSPDEAIASAVRTARTITAAAVRQGVPQAQPDIAGLRYARAEIPDRVEPMLNQVADGVWVRQSEWVWSNAIAVRGEDGLILVDPGIDGSDLNQLADDLDRLGIPVVAGFSTHPHWDHLLWHPRFGDGPRYATAAGARAASEARERGQRMAADSASGIPLELFGLVTPLPTDGGPVPGEIIEHQAHAIGHAAVLLADRGVLLAGDMLSDVLIPLLDPRRPDQVAAFETALDRLGEAAKHVNVLVPGHGAVAEGPEVAARLAADHAYIDALRRGEEPADARLSQDWLSGPHRSNLEQARGQ